MNPLKPYNPRIASHRLLSISALGGVVITLAFATSSPAATVTNFSNFSESGNLLTSPNIRQQTFTASGTSVTVTHASGSGAGQETYLSDEFPALAEGHRITVDLTSATWNAGQTAQTIALAVSSTETPSTRANLLIWGWRSGSMFAGVFGADGGYTGVVPAFPVSGSPDSVFIERTATGWTLGSIKGATETLQYTDVTSIGGRSITANGNAFGLFSDMRIDSGTWTVNNLTIVPEPSGTLLGGMMLSFGLLRRRRPL
jgi:hypothetical protein